MILTVFLWSAKLRNECVNFQRMTKLYINNMEQESSENILWHRRRSETNQSNCLINASWDHIRYEQFHPYCGKPAKRLSLASRVVYEFMEWCLILYKFALPIHRSLRANETYQSVLCEQYPNILQQNWMNWANIMICKLQFYFNVCVCVENYAFVSWSGTTKKSGPLLRWPERCFTSTPAARDTSAETST